MGGLIDGFANSADQLYEGGAATLDAVAGSTDESVGGAASGDLSSLVPSFNNLDDGLYSAYSEATYGVASAAEGISPFDTGVNLENTSQERYDVFAAAGGADEDFAGPADWASDFVVDGTADAATDAATTAFDAAADATQSVTPGWFDWIAENQKTVVIILVVLAALNATDGTVGTPGGS